MSTCALAAEAKVETPEGALTIKSVAGKAVAVFTRDAGGRVRFRMMRNVRKVAEQQPVVKVTVENGQAFRVGPQQVVFKAGMVTCRADALRAGDRLEPAFHFPAGYRFREDAAGTERVSEASVRIVAVDPGGAADLYSFAVHPTGTFFLSAGVLCQAEVAEPQSTQQGG